MSSNLEGCDSVIKYLVFIFNFLFFIVGCGLLGLGIYLKVGDNKFIDVAEELSTISKYATLGNLMIAVGVIILIVAFFGCCGAIKENRCLLTVFFTFLMLIFILELAAGIFGFISRDEIEKQMNKDFVNAIENEYNVNGTSPDSPITKTIDKFQREFKCCGYNEYRDWQHSDFYKAKGTIPQSCCKNQTDTLCPHNTSDATAFNTKGCFNEVVKWFEDNMYKAAACGVAFAVLQILGLVFAMCLICALKRTGTMA